MFETISVLTLPLGRRVGALATERGRVGQNLLFSSKRASLSLCKNAHIFIV
jgi:hypothetical protein